MSIKGRSGHASHLKYLGMRPRTFCFIAVFVGYAAFAFFALATPIVVTEASTSEEQKVLLDCKHTDYRTYIKCLKRHKRHHVPHGENHLNFDTDCWDKCVNKCETETDCDKRCNHCLRKTKHKHQVITEYETECTSDDCTNTNKNNNDVLRSTNITTKIDIHNIISNGSGMCCPTCQPPIHCPPVQPYPPVRPPINPGPQLTLVPQLTLGLGFSLGGGCLYPNQWPCSPSIDCSGCNLPYNNLRCDISCHAVQGTHSVGPPQSVNPNNLTPCTSPYCVGGIAK